MADLRWSLTAEEDLQAIENFIAKDSVLHAVNFIDRLIDAAEQLTPSPKVGRVVPEFNKDDLREILFRAYRIVYQLRGETACSESRMGRGTSRAWCAESHGS